MGYIKRPTKKFVKFVDLNEPPKAKLTADTISEFWETALFKEIPVKYGEGLFFSTAILHGSNINEEKETRFSLNIRFKNIFSPSGLKNQLQFFNKLQVSDLTEIGSNIEFQKSKFLNQNYNQN